MRSTLHAILSGIGMAGRDLRHGRAAQRPVHHSKEEPTWATRKILGAFLALGAVLAVPPGCLGARLLAEWSAIQGTEPGRPIRILLYRDLTPSGPLKFDGRFASATSDGLTLALKDGTLRTFAKREVRRVARRRPFFKRTTAWVVTGIALTVVGVLTSLDSDPTNLFVNQSDINIGRSIAIWFAPTYALSALASGRVMIYNVPRKHRSP